METTGERQYGQKAVPLAWALWGAALVTAAAFVLTVDPAQWTILAPGFPEPGGGLTDVIALFSVIGLFAVIATRLRRRESQNPLARWLAVFVSWVASIVLVDHLAAWLLTFTDRQSVGAAVLAGGHLTIAGAWATLGTIFLRFPTGRLLSRRWRFAEWIGWAGLVLLVLPIVHPDLFIEDGLVRHLPSVQHPLAVEALRPLAELGFIGWSLLPIITVAGVASIFVRYRRAHGDERQQLKWVGFGIALGWGGAFLATVLTGRDADGNPEGLLASSDLAVRVGDVAIALFIFVIPIAFLVAMFRYRLYDIDRVIRRTLAYAVVVVVLLGIYTAAVLALGTLGRQVTGGGAGDLGIALSTLLAAALFRPVQRRVRALVDRRFNRHREASLAAVEAFAERLRTEVDLAALEQDLSTVAAEVVEPETVSMWLHPRQERKALEPVVSS